MASQQASDQVLAVPSCAVEQNERAERLDRQVNEGLQVLWSIENVLRNYSGHREGDWLKQLRSIKAKAVKPNVVIGVVGSTGAGKSSVINALMDEERVIPTNPVRACTAVVTEIAYNHDDEFPYRAEIEFISKGEWEAELRILSQEILDERTFPMRATRDENSDVAVALSKVKAVYGFTKDEIGKYSVEELAAHEKVSDLLGTTLTISEKDPNEFYRAIKCKVESTEPNTRSGRPASLPAKQQTLTDLQGKWQVWPLIRVVRIYIKRPVLSTGVSIVDLPGVQDSNAARANIAASYLEKCSGLWIAAPVTRAVDDNVAQTLLGGAFKRQVQLDGGFGALTFICTKTDDYNLTEINEEFSIEKSHREACIALDSDITFLESRLQLLEEQKKEVREDLNLSVKDLTTLEDMQNLQGDAVIKGKRKGRCESNVSAGMESMCLDRDPVFDAEESKMSAEDFEKTRATTMVLTKKLYSDNISLGKKIEECRQQLAKDREQLESLKKDDLAALCVIARNNYAKNRIRDDFAMGIYELDLENGAAQDEDDFDPGVPIRDYKALGESLNVFCVSAKAYQKLQGRLRRDPQVRGFNDAEQTEIPRLRRYCMQATTKARIDASTNFLNSLEQFLNSLRLRTRRQDGVIELTKSEEDVKFLNCQLETLHKNLREVTQSTMSTLSTEFERLFSVKFKHAVTSASSASTGTVTNWNKPRSESGLAWNTYRAICRRGGVYQKPAVKYDWNEQLSQPMLTVIGPEWERIFQSVAPKVLDDFVSECDGHVKAFNSSVETHIQGRPAYAPFSSSFTTQMRTYKGSLSRMCSEAAEEMKVTQKAAHRKVSLHVEDALAISYEKAAQAKGKGSFHTSKEIMAQGVEESSRYMFQTSTNRMKSALSEMIASVQRSMESQIDSVFSVISDNYRSMFEQSQTAEDKAVVAELSALLRGVSMFQNEKMTAQQQNDRIATVERVEDPGPTEPRVKTEDSDFE